MLELEHRLPTLRLRETISGIVPTMMGMDTSTLCASVWVKDNSTWGGERNLNLLLKFLLSAVSNKLTLHNLLSNKINAVSR